MLLSGLKHYTTDLTAVVTVADDGGSSGRLRREMGIIPPGDIRNCLVALAEDESLMGSCSSTASKRGMALFPATASATFSWPRSPGSPAILKRRYGFPARSSKPGEEVLPASLDTVWLKAELDDGSMVRRAVGYRRFQPLLPPDLARAQGRTSHRRRPSRLSPALTSSWRDQAASSPASSRIF